MKIFYLFVLLLPFQLTAQVLPFTSIVNQNAPQGYYFTTPFITNGAYSEQLILDSAARVVYYHYFNFNLTYDFKIQPNNMMSYFNNNLHKFLLMDSTFHAVDTIGMKNGYTTDVHEVQILPNGHYLLLGLDTVVMDLSSYHYFNNVGAPGSTHALVLAAVIQEQDANKNVVFEWHAIDHFPFDSVDPYWLDSPALVDWIHPNALAMDNDGNILLSSRHFNEITKINRQDSSIMWRFGGNYNQFTDLGDTVTFYGQHDIRRLPNSDVTLYDDGNHRIPHGARAVEYRLDEVNKTDSLVWKYTYSSSMVSLFMGSVQRVEQGSTVVDYGEVAPPYNICFNVVDSSNNELFRIAFSDSLCSYRSFHYAQLPWQLQRPEISCFTQNGTAYLDAGNGYSAYRWSDGSTTQTIAVTTNDTFTVFVPYGDGGFISSQPVLASPGQGCITGIQETAAAETFKLYPNPAQDYIHIYSSTMGSNTPVIIKDICGKVVLQPQFKQDTYDISALTSGFYIVSVGNQSYKFIKR